MPHRGRPFPRSHLVPHSWGGCAPCLVKALLCVCWTSDASGTFPCACQPLGRFPRAQSWRPSADGTARLELVLLALGAGLLSPKTAAGLLIFLMAFSNERRCAVGILLTEVLAAVTFCVLRKNTLPAPSGKGGFDVFLQKVLWLRRPSADGERWGRGSL